MLSLLLVEIVFVKSILSPVRAVTFPDTILNFPGLLLYPVKSNYSPIAVSLYLNSPSSNVTT